MNYSALLERTVEVARAAGDIIARAWDAPRAARHKGKIDLVTETDIAVQAFLKEQLRPVAPGADFVGEEGEDNKNVDQSLTWIVDPVDGTTNFVHRLPFVAVSIALAQCGKPVLGVVFAPKTGECFSAAKGEGAFLNDRAIAVSEVRELTDAVVATGFPYDVDPSLDEILSRLARVLPKTQGLRRFGSAALDLCYAACGRIDIYYEAILKPWDMAAGWLIVEEAGGKVTALDGTEARAGGPVLASNGHLHEKALDMLNLNL